MMHSESIQMCEIPSEELLISTAWRRVSGRDEMGMPACKAGRVLVVVVSGGCCERRDGGPQEYERAV